MESVGSRLVQGSIFNDNFAWEVDKVNFEEYFQKFRKEIKRHPKTSIMNHLTQVEYLKESMNMTDAQVAGMESFTKISNLTCPGEITPFHHDLHDNEMDFKIKLQTHSDRDYQTPSTLLSIKNRRKRDEVFNSGYLKYGGSQWVEIRTRYGLRKDLSFTNFSEVIYVMSVYQPFVSVKGSSNIKLSQRILVRKDTKLSQFKDAIKCHIDSSGFKDDSDQLEEYPINAIDMYKSSMLLVGDTLYIDKRHPGMVDLSEEMRIWGMRRQFPKFKTGLMQGVSFEELDFKLGRPYVYQHQGNCEHLFVFSDVRLLEVSDSLKSLDYPLETAIARTYGKKCYMCRSCYAVWMVVNSTRLPMRRTFLCRACFKSYNYVNDEKIGDFQAYRYVDLNPIL